VDAAVPWRGDLAAATGGAVVGIAKALERLGVDIVLVVGDRVEAFAAATAGHLSGRVVAHVHGGDRALGQVDDALRHAITKLAHIHFPATQRSAGRIRKLGEDDWRIHLVGSPGVDGIRQAAASRGAVRREFGMQPKGFALLVLHPANGNDAAEEMRARVVLDAVLAEFDRVVVVYPNNDPGSAGIVKVWRELEGAGIEGIVVRKDVPRDRFLASMRDAAVLVGNSSSGIIEAASFGTPVVDVGPRQQGRERSGNVVHVEYDRPAIVRAVRSAKGSKWRGENVYGGGQAGAKMARILASIELGERLRHKLIAY
jgi:UDP-hydrolysing UDP-N-acetyl-D-glucosamine 2-epimerase